MYKISKWSETFETADTRKRQRLGWFMCPSGNESAGYMELMSRGEDGVLAFGVFIAICQWSATRTKEQRGLICRNDGREMSLELLASTIRISPEIICRSVPILCHPDIAWMTCENTGSAISLHNTTSNNKAESCQSPAGSLPVVCQSHPANSAIVKGQGEGQGEGQGKGRSVFLKPSVEEVSKFVQHNGYAISAIEFVDYYESVGWKIGTKPMKNWKAAVRTWERKAQESKPKKKEPMSFMNELLAKKRRGEITEDEFQNIVFQEMNRRD